MKGTEIRTEDNRMAMTFTPNTTVEELFEGIKALANINYEAGHAEGYKRGYKDGYEDRRQEEQDA